MKRIFPSSFYNIITLIGAAIAGISLMLILFLVALQSLEASPGPYVGIIAFIIMPMFLFIGLLVIAAGIIREHRRARLGKPHGLHLPVVDLNNPRHRSAFVYFTVGTVLVFGIGAFTSYQAYEYTESVKFCGETCHSVMEPEYTAYQNSPHARVACVECHIGSGASYFVKSKLSGSYQVYSVLFHKYPKPIPTPIDNLRPAQQTCEQCHWPQQFYNKKEHSNTYFLSDEHNTRWTLSYLMKIGGGNSEAGPTSGIHLHMNISNEITYAALDRSRQVIPWVRSRSKDGKETIYRSTEINVSDDSIAHSFQKKMDCIDCHNRPTHIYHPPERSVNEVMSMGWIDPSLPNVKSVAMKALELPYTTKQIALDSIRLYMSDYYKTNYPDVVAHDNVKIDSAIMQVQNIYAKNYFPEMGVSWKHFNDNIGHLYYPGCFRCHDGKHVSPEGKVLSRDCNTCHTILAQQFQNDSLRISLTGIDYRHPVDIGDAWKEMNCSDCHNSNQ